MAVSASIPIRFCLAGQVNNQDLTVEGHGHGDPSAGTYDLELTAKTPFPPGFAAVSPAYCQAPLRLLFSRPKGNTPSFADLTGGQFQVDPERRIVVFNAADEPVGGLGARSWIRWEDGVLVSEQRLCGHLDPAWLATVTHAAVPYDDVLDPLGPGRARGQAQCQLLGGSRGPLTCVAVVPYRWKGAPLPGRLVCTVREQTVDWDGARAAHVRVRSVLHADSMAAPSTPAFAGVQSTP